VFVDRSQDHRAYIKWMREKVMMMIERLIRITLLVSGLLCPLAVHAQAQPAAATQSSSAAPAQAEQTESQRLARTILLQMAQYLGKAASFSVTLRGGYDAVQASGQKIEFGEQRKVIVSRPDNRMRIEGEHSDGSKVLTVFNGKEITLVDSGNNVYASTPQTGNLDDTIVHFVSDLGVRMPLAAVFLSRMGAELNNRVRSIDYVEKTRIHGAAAHHLAARTDSVDFQVWVTDGDKPVPLRIVLTYREAQGQPQFWAQFSDWNFAPSVSDATFAVSIPKGAQKVAFAGQLARQSGAAKQPVADKGKGAK